MSRQFFLQAAVLKMLQYVNKNIQIVVYSHYFKNLLHVADGKHAKSCKHTHKNRRESILTLKFFTRATPMLARLLAVVISVCVSVTRRYCIETAARIELIFAHRFPSTYAALFFRQIRVLPKIRSLPLGTLSQTLDSEYFATAHRSSASAI